MTHPLGGFSAGYGPSGAVGYVPNFGLARPPYGSRGNWGNGYYGNGRQRLSGYPYVYSIWVPDYFDYLNDASQYYAPYGYPPAGIPPVAPEPGAPGGAGPSQPVIINQYFSGPPPAGPPLAGPPQVGPPEASNAGPVAPGEPLSTPENYYLIAYKDHEIYSALAYWVEDKTLHYVTTQNTHNQASLDLIDLTLTKSLNQDRSVPFSISGQ
jgi:hypothetical protein